MKRNKLRTSRQSLTAGLLVPAILVCCAAAAFPLAAAPTTTPAAPREWGLPLPAPYQLIGVETRIDAQSYDSSIAATQSTRIVVDLGKAAGSPAAFENLREWTILGEKGWGKATLFDIEKRCEYLCGREEGSESCYYVAIIKQIGGGEDIGTPLAALAGSFDLLDYEILTPEPPAPTEIPPQSSDNYSGALEKEDYSITAYDGDRLRLSIRQQIDGADDYVFDAEGLNCSAQTYGYFKLTNVNCKNLSMLWAGEPLLASYADYNLPKTTPLVEFSFGGSKYYVIRYGAKAEDIVGLVAAAPAGWRGLFKGRDRDLLC